MVRQPLAPVATSCHMGGVLALITFVLSGCASTEPTGPQPVEPEPVAVSLFDGEVMDPRRSRRIAYRVHYPVDLSSETPRHVLLVSHGGFGNAGGHRSAPWLGPGIAARGYIVVQIAHLPSQSIDAHLMDRPHDVTFILDRLLTQTLPLPGGLTSHLSSGVRVAHLGHSMGAYTSHAVAGATLLHGTFADPRIQAIIPFSPQGPDRFGFFDASSEGAPDDGPETSWTTVHVPVLSVVGAREMDGQPASDASRPGWRRIPFETYSSQADRILLVLPGQDHSDLWNTAPAAVQVYLIAAVADFLDAYVSERIDDGCAVGEAQNDLGVHPARRAAAGASRLERCSAP